MHHDQVSFRSYRRRFCLIYMYISLSIYPQRQWIWSVHYPVCYYLSINFTKLLPLIPRRFVLFPTYSGDRAIKWSCACQLDIEIQNIKQLEFSQNRAELAFLYRFWELFQFVMSVKELDQSLEVAVEVTADIIWPWWVKFLSCWCHFVYEESWWWPHDRWKSQRLYSTYKGQLARI